MFLITRGYGIDHKILTRGYGARLDLGGFIPSKKIVNYNFNISASVLKDVLFEQRIFCPFEINKNKRLLINSNVFKEIEEDLKLKINLNYSKLSDALDLL